MGRLNFSDALGWSGRATSPCGLVFSVDPDGFDWSARVSDPHTGDTRTLGRFPVREAAEAECQRFLKTLSTETGEDRRSTGARPRA